MGQYKIDKNKLKTWLQRRFGEVREKGKNLLINDPLGKSGGRPDTGFHMSFWPDGCCYNSWLGTERSGHILTYIAEKDNVSFEEAARLVCEDFESINARTLSKHIENVRKMQERKQNYATCIELKRESLPPGFVQFEGPGDTLELGALLQQKIIAERWIRPDQFGLGYVAKHMKTRREYRWPEMFARIVIPFYGPNGEIDYWAARDTLGQEPRYFNPPAPDGEEERKRWIARACTIWCSQWQETNKIYICEGYFDAMAICSAGANAIALGAVQISHKQISLIRQYLKPKLIVIALDNDTVGIDSVSTISSELRKAGWPIKVAIPPSTCKDWSAMWAAWRDQTKFLAWLESNEHQFTFARQIQMSVLRPRR